jgi:hypothetical protein
MEMEELEKESMAGLVGSGSKSKMKTRHDKLLIVMNEDYRGPKGYQVRRPRRNFDLHGPSVTQSSTQLMLHYFCFIMENEYIFFWLAPYHF